MSPLHNLTRISQRQGGSPRSLDENHVVPIQFLVFSLRQNLVELVMKTINKANEGYMRHEEQQQKGIMANVTQPPNFAGQRRSRLRFSRGDKGFLYLVIP